MNSRLLQYRLDLFADPTCTIVRSQEDENLRGSGRRQGQREGKFAGVHCRMLSASFSRVAVYRDLENGGSLLTDVAEGVHAFCGELQLPRSCRSHFDGLWGTRSGSAPARKRKAGAPSSLDFDVVGAVLRQ